MSYRNWLHNTAIAGWLIVAVVGLLVWSAYEYRHSRDEARYAAYQQRETASPCAAIIAPNQQKRSGQQKTLDDDPKRGPESDRCQQWRMAIAAEKQADLTETFLATTVVEIGALLLTLLATAWAAVAASRAAKAAQSSVEVASQVAEKQLRAYVVVKKCVLNYEGREPKATVFVTNCGQTPAERVIIVGGIYIIERPTTFVSVNFADNLSKGTLGRDRVFELPVGMKKPITDAEIDGLQGGTHTLVVVGEIEYTDVFGFTWTRGYEFCTGGKYGKALREGGLSVSSKEFSERKKRSK